MKSEEFFQMSVTKYVVFTIFAIMLAVSGKMACNF
jgi:hypothetical protein